MRRQWPFKALRFLVLLVVFATCSRGASADDAAVSGLSDLLSAIDQLSGSFQQTITATEGDAPQLSSGTFRILRPDHFYWEITAPDAQLLVARDGYLWHLDRDLETATRRPVAAGGGMAPLQVLAGDPSVLETEFTVSQLASDRYRLVPLSAQAGFVSVEVRFADGLPEGMTITDALSQTIEIRFSGLSTTGVSRDDFVFSPPDGTDVYYYDQ